MVTGCTEARDPPVESRPRCQSSNTNDGYQAQQYALASRAMQDLAACVSMTDRRRYVARILTAPRARAQTSGCAVCSTDNKSVVDRSTGALAYWQAHSRDGRLLAVTRQPHHLRAERAHSLHSPDSFAEPTPDPGVEVLSTYQWSDTP